MEPTPSQETSVVPFKRALPIIPRSSLKTSAANMLQKKQLQFARPIKIALGSQQGSDQSSEMSIDLNRSAPGFSQEKYSSPSKLKTRCADYQPYTIKDYRMIKSSVYYELPKLSSGVIGTDPWRAKQEALMKRKTYGKHVELANNKRLSQSVGRETKYPAPAPQSSRDRALEFAKTIQRPPLQINRPAVREETPVQVTYTSMLQRLEQKHHDYKKTVDQIKAKIE